MRQGVILKDTSLIIIRKAEITPEVQPNPSLSLDIVQSMINSTFERQAKSSDELVRRFIEERDGKKLADSCAVSFAQTNPQPSGTSVDDTTFTAEPPLMVSLLLLGCYKKLQSASSAKGICKPHLAFLYAKL
jgi:hypothetical protein